jgi:hypothetical protein
MGTGRFTEVRPLISGYKGRYDLYAKWGRRNAVLEFKFDLFGLFKDFSDERKMFDQIDCVIVWEITERDRREAHRRGISINILEKSSLSSPKVFPDASSELSIDAVKGIFVVELRHVIERATGD